MNALLSTFLFIAEGRSENPGTLGKVLTIVGIILAVVLLVALGLWLVNRLGHTRTRSLDSHSQPPGEVGRGGKERREP